MASGQLALGLRLALEPPPDRRDRHSGLDHHLQMAGGLFPFVVVDGVGGGGQSDEFTGGVEDAGPAGSFCKIRRDLEPSYLVSGCQVFS